MYKSLIFLFFLVFIVSCNDDLTRTYYSNGQIRDEGFEIDKKREGTWNFYYENGQLEAVKNYSKGILDSTSIEYWNLDEVKELSTPVQYRINFDTLQQLPIKYIRNYKNGLKNGKEIYFFKLGDSRHATYVNDTLQGIMKGHFDTGELEGEGNFIDGNLEGKYIRYYKSGKIFSEENYINGKREGKVTAYHESGNIKWTLLYENNLREGPQVWYYNDGTIEAIHNYKNNYMHGDWKFFYPNGKLKSKAIYDNGKIKENKIEFAQDGSPIKK